MKLDFTRYSLGFVMLAAMCLVSGFVQSGCDKPNPVAEDFKKAVGNEKPVSAVAKNEFEGCTLIEPPKEIAAQDVALLRNFLKRESATGRWEEVEWRQKIEKSHVENKWDAAQGQSVEVRVAPHRYIVAEIRTQVPSGNVTRTSASLGYDEDQPNRVELRTDGFNEYVDRSRYLTTSISPE